MKSQLLIYLFFVVLCPPLCAQLGVTTTSTFSEAATWQVVPDNFLVNRRSEFLRYGFSGVVDYAFTLKNKNIRLRPAVQVMQALSIYPNHHFGMSMMGIQGNIEFAFWRAVDKSGKEVPFRPFLQLSPGLSYISLRYDRYRAEQEGFFERHKSHELAMNYGANLFVEFKLTELLTVAPTAGVRIFPNLNWKDFTELVMDGIIVGTYDQSNLLQYNLGMRVGLLFRH